MFKMWLKPVKCFLILYSFLEITKKSKKQVTYDEGRHGGFLITFLEYIDEKFHLVVVVTFFLSAG